MPITYVLWGLPPDRFEQVCYGEWPEDKWQQALQAATRLREKGIGLVEILEVDDGVDEEIRETDNELATIFSEGYRRMFSDAAVISAWCIGIGVLIEKAIAFYRARSERKLAADEVNSKIQTNEIQQALCIYKEMIASLREDLTKLLADFHKQEEQYIKLQVENAALKEQLKQTSK